MIILASASPRRKEILEQMGLEFTVMTADTGEFTDRTDPGEMVMALSAMKADAVLCRAEKEHLLDRDGENLIIAADTLVFADGKVLGKPGNRQEAYDMLDLLQGRSHEVRTGVTLVYITCEQADPGSEKTKRKISRYSFYEETGVCFNPMSASEIDALIDTGEPMDKAGAYGIQGRSAKFIKGIKGDYYNVMGLPMAALYTRLKEIGFIKEG